MMHGQQNVKKPPIPTLRQLNPVHALPPYLEIDYNTSHLLLGLESGLFPVSFPTKTVHAPLPSSTRTISNAVLGLGEIRVQKYAQNDVGGFCYFGENRGREGRSFVTDMNEVTLLFLFEI
jgi:hypothetical protein